MGIKPCYKTNSCALYQCDNLELMKQLPDNYIDLIYCDILYGTGKNFGDYLDLKPIRKEIENHYLPRLIQMKRILKETGSIYLQMDTKINHWIRIICDDIFNYENFRNELVWCYSGGGIPKMDFAKKHDYILRYSKSNLYVFNVDDVRQDYSQEILSRSKSSYAEHSYKNNPDTKTIRWDLNPKGKYPDDWFYMAIVNPCAKERVDYQTQKPKLLLEKIIKASSNKNDIVADFYMGSGTSGEVALENGRKFIGCDIGERACKLTQERLEKYT